MTTIAMGAGMMPIALGIGTDPSFRAPMAIVVIGGLITSTFLSLLVIPVVFTFVDDGVQKRSVRAPYSHAAALSPPPTGGAAGPGRPPLSRAAGAKSAQASLPERRCEPPNPTPNS